MNSAEEKRDKPNSSSDWMASEIMGAKQAKARVDELQTRISELELGGKRDRTAALFAVAGLPAEAVDVFIAELPADTEIDEDSVRSFGTAFGYVATEPGEEEDESVWEPLDVKFSIDNTDVDGMLTEMDADRLLRDDADKWVRLRKEGRIPEPKKIGKDKPADWPA